MEFDVQLAPLPVSISFSDEDVRRLAVWLRPLLRHSRKPFADLHANELTEIVRLLTNFIHADRIIDEPGKGGWALSDCRWHAAVLDPEGAKFVRDSVLTTCSVTNALIRCAEFKCRAKRETGLPVAGVAKPLPDPALEDYFRLRWNGHTGEGGILQYDKEAGWEIRPSYRHTARLLRMWIDLPEYAERIDRTVNCLLARFDTENWKEQPVTTAVAAYVAVRRCVELKVCLSRSDRLEELATKLERIIIGKYKPELAGWTFRESVARPKEIGRQSYTLLTLAELFPVQNALTSDLVELMSEALHETISGRWGVVGDAGIPLVPGKEPNVSMSCLAISALARKGAVNKAEQEFSRKVLGNIRMQVNRIQESCGAYYSWAVSYFLEDVCRFLRDLKTE